MGKLISFVFNICYFSYILVFSMFFTLCSRYGICPTHIAIVSHVTGVNHQPCRWLVVVCLQVYLCPHLTNTAAVLETMCNSPVSLKPLYTAQVVITHITQMACCSLSPGLYVSSSDKHSSCTGDNVQLSCVSQATVHSTGCYHTNYTDSLL